MASSAEGVGHPMFWPRGAALSSAHGIAVSLGSGDSRLVFG